MDKPYLVITLLLIFLAAGGIGYYFYGNSCETTSLKMRSLMDEANFCNDPSDCNITSLGCPFGCYNFVNKDANLSAITEMSKGYNLKCPSCTYKCPIPPPTDQIACLNGKCVDKRFQ